MVTIITGPRNSGKSTHFLRLYQEAGGMDIGIFSKKLFDSSGHIAGYDLILLPSGDRFPLARLNTLQKDSSQENRWHQGQFTFFQSAFEQATTYVLNNPSTRVWIDEVGKLELRGLGYAHLIRQLLEKNTDITLTIRESYAPVFFTIFMHIDNE